VRWPPKCWQGLFTTVKGKGTNDPDPWWCRRCGATRCIGMQPCHVIAGKRRREAYLNSIGASGLAIREAQFEKALRENVDVA